MPLSTARPEDDELPVRPPALGARLLPGPRLRDHHRGAVDLVGADSELKHQLGATSFAAAAALADAVIRMVNEVVGHDLAAHRTAFCEAGHFGGMVAVAEERAPGSESGRVAPHAAAVLACVEAQFSGADQLAEQLSRWLLEAGYFLVRSGSATQPLVDALRVDLTRLVDEVGEAEEKTAPAVRLPRPGVAPDSVADEVFTAR